MALFRRRAQPEVDYDRLAKALTPAIAMAAQNSGGVVQESMLTGVSSSAQWRGQGGFSALDRQPENFSALLGPGYPLLPDPLDHTGTNGRTLPRRSEYLVAWNLQLVDKQTPWTMLRWLAEDCDVVNRAIQLTQDEQCGLEWDWTYSPKLLHQIMVETGETSQSKASAIARDKYGDKLHAVRQFFEFPDLDMNQSFHDWLQALLWDHLVYDGVAIYPRYNLDGSLRNLELIDASTIKIYLDGRGRLPQAPNPAYGQILYGFPRGEFQYTPEEADGEFTNDQLSYFIRRPRNTSVYGYPQVEEVMALATTYLARQAWMRAEYSHGSIPKMLVETSETETWSPEQLAFFEQIFNDRLSGQIERRQGAFFMRPGMKATWAPQVEEKYKRDYDDWLVGQIASRFGRPASMLGVQAKAGLSGGRMMEGEVNQSDIYSGKALTNWIIGLLNTLARKYLGVGPEITAKATGGMDEDIESEVKSHLSMVDAGVTTRNEMRSKYGYPLVDEPEADQLAITTGQGVTFLPGLIETQKATLAAQQQAPNPSAPKVPEEATAPPEVAQKATVTAAGIVVKADDTGRVLMVQRAGDNHNEAAAGRWEWPGGVLEDGEDSFTGARREWEEEVGVPLPKGRLAGSWQAGIYQGFVWMIKSEDKLDLSKRDPDGEVESVAWWDPVDVQSSGVARIEVQSSDWGLIGGAKKAELAELVQRKTLEYLRPDLEKLMTVTYQADVARQMMLKQRSSSDVQPVINVRVPDVHVDAPISVEPVKVYPQITVNPAQAPDVVVNAPIHVDAPQISVPPATVNIKPPNVNISPPDVHVNVEGSQQSARTVARSLPDGSVVIERS